MLILIGLIMLALGILMVVFRRQIYNFTGYIEFVESWFPGGTNAFLLVFGCLLVLVGALFVTGIGNSITDPISQQLKSVFGGLK